MAKDLIVGSAGLQDYEESYQLRVINSGRVGDSQEEIEAVRWKGHDSGARARS